MAYDAAKPNVTESKTALLQSIRDNFAAILDGTQAATKIKVESGSAGSFTPSTSADELLVEGSGDTGMSITGGGSNYAGVRLGDAGSPSKAILHVNNSDDKLSLVNNDGGDIALEISSSDVFLASSSSIINGVKTIINNPSATTTDDGLVVRSTNVNYAGFNINSQVDRAASSAYSLFVGVSDADGTPDTEFDLQGDGNGYCDGSWTGGGADYAEFFESVDGESIAPGTTVTLDGSKVRACKVGEAPIGVISANPSAVGNGAIKYKGKYLRDEFGAYMLEDKEVTYDVDTGLLDDDGNKIIREETVTHQVRRLNPDYDPTQTYIPREKRPEWNVVGLMGQIAIRKGQPTAPNWIKMKEISETVELYLVR